ncbi:TPA: hypothetical protein EYP66_01080 [Candidatus Poribacteria bacterium]|nr:hypothetical protein [Candidatus Poribacteria bacterium]
MTLYQKHITFALILLFIFATFGVAEESTDAEKAVDESSLLNEIKSLKERIAHLEDELTQAVAELERMQGPPRNTSDSAIDVDPEKHRLEVERHLAYKEMDVNAEMRKLELEQDLAQRQSEQQRNIITFSAEQEAETTKFQYEMKQSVREREYEKNRAIEIARIGQEQEIREREIEMALVIETAQIDQRRQVQEAEIEKNAMIEKAHIEKYTTVHLAEMDAELEKQRKELEVKQEMQKVKEEIAAIEAEHRQKMAGLTRLAVLPLNVKASEIADLVEPFLSEHAIVSVDDEGNVLVIRDVEHCVKDVEMIAEKLDILREKSGQDTK